MRIHLLSCAALFLLAASPVLEAEKPKIPDGPGKDAVIRVCSQCHGVEVAASRRESRDGWNAIVADMIERGATGTDDEFGQIVEYLATNFSKDAPAAKIEVNKASAALLQSALELPKDQAAAIVQYRDTNGPFKSFEELVKVPGVDAVKLESKKANLIF